jgi:hypothetical protein
VASRFRATSIPLDVYGCGPLASRAAANYVTNNRSGHSGRRAISARTHRKERLFGSARRATLASVDSLDPYAALTQSNILETFPPGSARDLWLKWLAIQQSVRRRTAWTRRLGRRQLALSGTAGRDAGGTRDALCAQGFRLILSRCPASLN